MTAKEKIVRIVEELPESEAIRFLEYLKKSVPDTALLSGRESREERRARVYAIAGSHADSLFSTEELSRMKQEEIELEESKIRRAFGTEKG